jgi:phosphoglucosamine mutase
LDGANGAACKIAPQVFKKLGANVVASNCHDDGLRINDNCGALYPETLAKRMKRYKADLGFAFDGDADRLIVVDEKGRVVDGDAVIYMLANHLKDKGLLRENTVVGTSHTNMAIEKALRKKGISFIRTDIGDKYVLAELLEKGLSLGGEQSGHIILKDLHTTGDGILSAVAVANMLVERKAKISDLFDVALYPQVNLNVPVEDKLKVINSERLADEVGKIKAALGDDGRVMVRASGTEPKIRIMVESADEERNRAYANHLAAVVKAIEK